MSLVCLAKSIPGCSCTALDKIKKYYYSALYISLCVREGVCSTVNKIKVIQTDFSLQTQNRGLLCSPTPLPFLFFSCQCQRSGSVNRPDGCRTQSPLSPFIPPFFPPRLTPPFFLSPPTNTPPSLFFISSHSSICPHTLLSLSWRCSRGCTPLSCPGLCCQAFPKLNFPSLTAVCLLRRLPKK